MTLDAIRELIDYIPVTIIDEDERKPLLGLLAVAEAAKEALEILQLEAPGTTSAVNLEKALSAVGLL